MGLTGLGLSGFVLTHMLGNLLIFLGADAYNLYGYKLTSNPIIYVAEMGLLAMVLCHIVIAFWLTKENKAARPVSYAYAPQGKAEASLASRTMIYSGTVLLVFIVHHLITFKYGPHYDTTVDGVVMRDLHRLMVEVFANPLYVIWYVVALLLMLGHLKHGVASTFQSLGFNHPKYTPWIKCAGVAYAFIVVIGFISQPLYVYFFQK